ncbi:MAG: site-specific integrase [Deferribacteraceae bacterium]|jgi:integrase|nr:site-specific integrase [Deferribacteraceae bacterium]
MGMAHIISRYKKHRLYIYFRFDDKAFKESAYCHKEAQKGCVCKQHCVTGDLTLEVSRKVDNSNADVFKTGEYIERHAETAYLSDKDVTVIQYAWQWLATLTGVRSTTVIKYRQTIKKLSYITQMRLCDVRAYHIREWVKDMESSKLAPKTIKEHICTLSTIFKSAIRDNLITDNPCAGVKLPKLNSPDPDPFSVDEVSKILNWIGKKYPEKVTFYAIGFYAGMRTGEIIGLKWSSIDFNSETIKVCRQHTSNEAVEMTKTGSHRIIDIIPQLMPYLKDHRQYTFVKSEYLFLTQYDTPYMTGDDLSRYYWDPCLKALGIRYRNIYHMRHTFACMMLNNNKPINWIAMRMLGHKNSSLLLKIYGAYWSQNNMPDKSSFDFLNPQNDYFDSLN